jgi:hypothetical protein
MFIFVAESGYMAMWETFPDARWGTPAISLPATVLYPSGGLSVAAKTVRKSMCGVAICSR